MDDDVEDTHVLRELLLQAQDADEDMHEDDHMDSSSEMSQQSAAAGSSESATGASAWNCSRCTYENTVSSSICEICGSPRESSSSSAPSSATDDASGDGKWECGACTLLNPRQAHVCVVCSTPNPTAMGATSRRGLSIASALGFFTGDRVVEKNSSHVGITGDALEALAKDPNASVKLTDTLQSLTHNLAMMEASSEGGFGLFMMGRSKGNRMRQDPKLGNVLSSILKEKERHTLETRLLACQSLNYLIKMDIRVSDGKKTNEWMLQYLAVMDEMARLDGESKLQKQLAEESANGLESLCQSHPFVFRELCNAEPLECLLHFVSYANTLHLNVLLTSLSMLLKVCQKVHIQEKPRKTSRQCSSDQSSLGSIMSTLLRCIHHANPRVQVATIKGITTLYHRTPLHAYMTADCIRQLLRIMVETSNDDTLDASRAAVSLLTELIDESALLLSTVMLSDVYEPLTQQVTAILQSESVATPTLRFLSKLTSRLGQRAGGATKTNEVLHRFLLAFVKANAISTVSALLKDGADLHESPSPLLIAVSDSSLSMVRLLVKKGADVTGQALHIAAEAKRCDVVSLLLQHGANPASLNEAGETLHQVVAKYPDHPVAKLLAMYDGHDSEDHPPPPVSLTASTTSPGSQVLISDFSREWNDMDTEEEEESEHYDEDMHSEDEYHDMYGDEDESHDDEEEDEEDDEMLDEESKDDDDSSLHLEDKDEVLSKQENDLSVSRNDASRFTHNLFTSLIRVVQSIDNKQVTYAVLSTMANVLIYPIDLSEADVNVLLELIHGLLMERNDGVVKEEEGELSPLNIPAMVLALRLLHALSSLNNTAKVVAQMERQGILDHLNQFSSQTHELPVEKTMASLVSDWLKDITPSASSSQPNPVVLKLTTLCAQLQSDPSNEELFMSILGSIDKGITTYELTKSPVIPTLLSVFAAKKYSWNSQMQELVRHLHQVVGLNEMLPIISHGMPKGKEFYPLTRQLRCRMRLLPSKQNDSPPRSIHASPLTLFSSFERTVFRCANITDPKWLKYAWSLVGEPIWKQVDGKWIEAMVCGFDPTSGCHLLYMSEEYVEEVLQEETYRLVKTPMKVYGNVEIDLNHFGSTPSLKRKTEDGQVRRSKRIKRKALEESAVSAVAISSPQDTDGQHNEETDEVKIRERRLLDVLKLHDSSSAAEGDKVWVSSGSDICVCGTYIKKLHSQVEVEVTFGNQVNVPLVVAESNFVQYQAKARPGSSSSKVQRMLGALDSHGRGNGRPVIEHLKRLLSRSRQEPVNVDDTAAGAAASPPIPHFRAANKKGKQKAKSHLPLITKSQEDFTVLAPPVVRVLLGYGEFSDKPDEQRNWLISDDHLNEEVQPVLRWLFHAFAAGERPDAKPHSLDVPAETPTWPLAVFSAFCEEVKLGFMASEEWTLFSQFSSADLDRSQLTWDGFSSWLVNACKDSRQAKCFCSYLDQLGFKRTSLQKEQKEPIQLFEFAAEDNLFYCLHTIHPNQNLGSMPWKIVFNVYCDYRITWEDEKKTTNKSNANTSLSKSGETSSWGPVFAQSINLLETLYRSYGAEQSKELWLNPRLSRKLRMQLQDVLSITSGTYPTWCDALVQKCKLFFPMEMRYTLFRTTAFGFSRSLHWFRDHLDLESNNEELSISPLPKERAKVDRMDIIKSADAVMKVHSKRKAILDIVFVGERGYGSGVTAAFYSAVAEALQCNKDVRLWVSGHEESDDHIIRHPNGLFPSPTSEASDVLKDRFRLMGRLAGKALLDERLLPLPFSSHFLNLVLRLPVPASDLETIFLQPGRIILSLYKASQALKAGDQNIFIESHPLQAWLESVDLNFIDPLTQCELERDGAAKTVTIENLDKYVDLVLKSWLNCGIESQVEAFREGLSEIVSLDKLKLLFVDELQATLCGTVDVEWTRDSLRQTIKLAHGYTSSSAPIEYFIDVLVEMSASQRRAFLLYATGCPNLPPGGSGFEKLKPQFEVVRRVIPDDQNVDRSLPFARTCTNTLHLPAYSTKEILAQQLEYAVQNSKGVIDRD
ncbi:hypothetical protein AeMF1_002667 [Aphanomyces euteiches]|nr:hypothetical protein AeMF1_002667 [Aphanomyces euteiches]KAH9191349.1 hypothetical protein AeNC1_006678 [Aphanomyces euteiches]